MKNLLNLFILGMFITVVATSCKKDNDDDNNDDNNNNTPPYAAFTVTPNSGEVGTTFSFDASLCSDAEEPVSELEVRWDWENDGVYDTDYSTTKTTIHQYNTGGLFTIKLEVRDNGGLTATSTYEIEVISLPGELTFVTGSGSDITETTAIMTGTISSLGEHAITDHGHCWSLFPDPTIDDEHYSLGNTSSTGNFSSNLIGLTESLTYYVKAYVTTSQGTFYGEEIALQTAVSSNVTPCQGTPTVTDNDGNVYNTVEINGKCWMRENLKTGNMINSSTNQSDNGTLEKYCFDNIEENCEVYGGLYQWNEVMQYVNNTQNQGICPDGWHIPDLDEMKDIRDNIVSNNDVILIGQSGSSTNSSGFSSLLSGYETIFDGFTEMTTATQYWSTQKYITGNAAYALFVQITGDIIIKDNNTDNALSLRCIKDN